MSEKTFELNTGIVIAGAYADKVRRTLFAQQSQLVRKSKEFAKEVARASAEINSLLYYILVENLKIEKGDAVRIRVKYSVDETQSRVIWDYDSLTVEFFKRVPDEQVKEVVRKVVESKLKEVLEKFQQPMSKEQAEALLEAEIKKAEKVLALPEEKPAEVPKPAPPDILAQVAGAEVLGETTDGGFLVKLERSDGVSMGLVSLVQAGEEVVLDAVLVTEETAVRYIHRTPIDLRLFVEEPRRVLEELRKARPSTISKEEARTILHEKMQTLV